jgi:LysM repeat protein
MNRNHRAPNLNSDELFAEAVGRLEAGEPLAQILDSYPADLHTELFEMLSIVQATRELGQISAPRPSAARRAAAKQNFLAAAAQMRAEKLGEPYFGATPFTPSVSSPAVQRNSQPPATPIPARPTPRKPVMRRQSLWGQMMDGMQGLFANRALRLAPLLLLLALVLVSTSTLVAVAQYSVPGDVTYSLKEWIRKQELELAPPDRRELVRQEQEQELAEDVRRAAERADLDGAVIQDEVTQVYYGRNGRLLKIGGLTVMDRYQPDGNVEVFREMTIEGDLEPGAQVQITYQILPGQSDTVQGIALTVVAPPTETPTAGSPDEIQPQVAGCSIVQPEGWVPYEVRVGDNLTFLATRGGTTVDKVMEVNCLETEVIVIGAKLYVPAASLKTDTPLLQCGSDRPTDWVLYEVQAGDNLSAIAQRTGASVSELMAVNCLGNDTILIGAKLYVPSATPTP